MSSSSLQAGQRMASRFEPGSTKPARSVTMTTAGAPSDFWSKARAASVAAASAT